MSVFTDFFAGLQELLVKHSESLGQQTVSAAVLGEDREFFIRTVLDRCLPASVAIGRGVVVDFEGRESNPQDVVLYRTDFPSIAGLVGSRRFLAEGVTACIEVKSELTKKEFNRALTTLKTAGRRKVFDIDVPPGLSEQEADGFKVAIGEFGYTKNQQSTRRYVFAYRGVTWDTLRRYIRSALKSGISFWELPSAICILSRRICLVRDDGQVLRPYPARGSSQCIYCRMEDGRRALEFFMMHVLSSCLLAGPPLRVYGTPLRFSVYRYMDQPVAVRPVYAHVRHDISSLRIEWDEKGHVTTNRLLIDRQLDAKSSGDD